MSLSRCGDYSHFSAVDAAAAANFTLIATIPFFFFVLFTLLFRLHCCFIFIQYEILLYLCLRFIFSSDVCVCVVCVRMFFGRLPPPSNAVREHSHSHRV